MANYRVQRLAQEINREVNNILRTIVKDPRVVGITITDVDVSGDLQQATIFYSSLSELASQRDAEQTGLEKSSGIIRRELGRRLTLYKIPDIYFKRDMSIDYGNHIDELIRKINTRS